MDRASPGSVVLVHGLWGNPEDWRWVGELIEDAGAVVVAPDLPSHRSPEAGTGAVLPIWAALTLLGASVSWPLLARLPSGGHT
ncbi:alpha/beta fold hydrolase [Humibacillus xanthopallidus]|uniref:alpha/beta fold hydrolase n=1 Tax=Humibacillus xanthopallidus TaxID=412689 RepID=UPI0035D700FE